MHGLPCRGLAASIKGCDMKNSPGKPGSFLFRIYYLTHAPVVDNVLQLLFNEFFCKVPGLARRGFLASGGQSQARSFFKRLEKS
jgi:hypothetical protein